jgi:TetR/AcrR family transcriptional repressor of nem operon
MSNRSIPEGPNQPFSRAVPDDAYEPPGLIQSLDSLSIALKALQMVTDAGSAAAANVPRDATGEEVRQRWLASLMPLRYTVQHLLFRSSSLTQAIGAMTALPNGKGLSPRRINVALDTIVTRRFASGAPTTNGWVSKAGHGAATTASRVGCGMSSSRAMAVPPSRYLGGRAATCQVLKCFIAFASIRSKLDGVKLPRPREFDEGVALEAAMQRFWADGFAATSVRDIGSAMGLGQASVYNAFGDKRTLFTQCLDRYLDANMRARIARLEKSLPPRQAIETFLTEIVERSLESRLGCLLANAALEVAPHDPEIAAVVAERMGELEAFFRRCVIAGQRDGSISPGVDPADAGRLLLTTVMGLRVLARGFPNRAVLEGAARQALSALGKPVRRRKPSVRSQIAKGKPR